MFAPVLKMALDSRDLMDAIKNGFRSCGLWPFNADAVNYNVLSKKNKTKCSNNNVNTAINLNEDAMTKNKEVLLLFEKNIIDPTILECFKQAQAVKNWNGDVRYQALFESWLKLKELCNGK